jgi:thymidylate synthase
LANVNPSLVNVDNSSYSGGFGSTETSRQFSLNPTPMSGIQAASASALQMGGGRRKKHNKTIKLRIKKIASKYKKMKGGKRLTLKSAKKQLQSVINDIKKDPYSRRHMVISYNPGELDLMALPPCHVMFQFYVSNQKLSCHMYQRSADVPLGVPFNIASYALLTHMIAQICGLTAGDLIISFGDAHIYQNQIQGVQEQLSRNPLPLPSLWLNPNIARITDFSMSDVDLVDYQSHSTISMPMAV